MKLGMILKTGVIEQADEFFNLSNLASGKVFYQKKKSEILHLLCKIPLE